MKALLPALLSMLLVGCGTEDGGEPGEVAFSFAGFDGIELNDGDDARVVEGIQGGRWLMLRITPSGLGNGDPDQADCGLAAVDTTLSNEASLSLAAAKADSTLVLPLNIEIVPEERPASDIEGAPATIYCDLEGRYSDVDVILRFEEPPPR